MAFSICRTMKPPLVFLGPLPKYRTNGGLVIDLAKMRNVEIEPLTKIAKVQGGCIWQDVDEAAADHGLAMVGGTVNHTGVGGAHSRRRIRMALWSIWSHD